MKRIYLGLLFLLLGMGLILSGCGTTGNEINNNLNKESQINQNLTDDNVDTELHGMGLIPISEEEYDALPKDETYDQIVTAPAKVDLSGKFAHPGDQGRQGSCVAWATAYALKTYLEKVDFGWDQNQPEHKFSPAYVYNQINGGKDQGAQISDGMKLIVNQGVCSLKTMPYSDKDFKKQPNAAQKKEAAKYKSKNWGTLKAGDVKQMKGKLAANAAIVVGIPVHPDFMNINNKNQIYDNDSGELKGYHAICFVGYDDSKKAFKFINSWGANWGLNGFGYMSYALIEKLKIQACTMQDNVHKP